MDLTIPVVKSRRAAFSGGQFVQALQAFDSSVVNISGGQYSAHANSPLDKLPARFGIETADEAVVHLFGRELVKTD